MGNLVDDILNGAYKEHEGSPPDNLLEDDDHVGIDDDLAHLN